MPQKLIVEIMGKHSNIIFCKEDGTIIDSIKHVSAQVSSVREVLPGRTYFIPRPLPRKILFSVTEETFRQTVGASSMSIQKALYNHLTGISPIMAEEICHLASIDSDYGASELSETELLHLYHTFSLVMEDVKEGRFAPAIVFDEEGPAEYAAPAPDLLRRRRLPQPVLPVHEPSAGGVLCFPGHPHQNPSKVFGPSPDRPDSPGAQQQKYDLQLKQLKDTENARNTASTANS